MKKEEMATKKSKKGTFNQVIFLINDLNLVSLNLMELCLH